MDPAALSSLLTELGYEIRRRDDGWSECLLLREGEAHLGRGRTPDEALEAAVRAACPSALALTLLERALPVRAAGAGACAPELEPAPVAARPPPFKISKPSGPPLLAPRSAAPVRVDLAEALEDLALLAERIDDARDELALCSPERQRLAILAWICEARAQTDHFPEEQKVREQVAAISRQLTEIGKAYWPGSVTALQLQMSPREIPRPLLGGTANTWGRAAELAERALAVLEHGEERRGLDPYGWADAARLDPLPAEPNAILDALVAEVEAHGGGLERSAEARDPEARPAPETFAAWVRTLRWLRPAPVDAERWGRVAGRLRWWSSRRDPRLAAGARELDPGFAPQGPWADAFPAVPRASACNVKLPCGLLAQVAPAIAGRSLLFVSFRRDPELMARLQAALAGARLEWRVAEPARAREIAAGLEGGGVDAVLSAIGLQAHEIDQALARAARRAQVAYVRVNWGRPLACLRGLARARLPARTSP